MQKWAQLKPSKNETASSAIDVDLKIAKLMESQSLGVTKQKECSEEQKKYTEEQKKIREAILSQYSQMSDEEEDDEEPAAAGGDSKENGLEKNTNALTVAMAEKAKREQAKMDSQKKKEKDKEDRYKKYITYSITPSIYLFIN